MLKAETVNKRRNHTARGVTLLVLFLVVGISGGGIWSVFDSPPRRVPPYIEQIVYASMVVAGVLFIWSVVEFVRAIGQGLRRKVGLDEDKAAQMLHAAGLNADVVIGPLAFDTSARKILDIRDASTYGFDDVVLSIDHKDNGTNVVSGANGVYVQGKLPSLGSGYYININTQLYDKPRITTYLGASDEEAQVCRMVIGDLWSGKFSQEKAARMPAFLADRTRQIQKLAGSLQSA